MTTLQEINVIILSSGNTFHTKILTKPVWSWDHDFYRLNYIFIVQSHGCRVWV